MSFGANPTDVSVLKDYAAAARWEAEVKPIRGRANECKPLGARNKSHANIRKEGEDIVVRLYRTDIVRYKPDGTIIVNQGGYESQTTRKYLNAVLPMWFNSYQGMTNVWRNVEGGGRHLLHASEDNIFVPANNVSSGLYHFVNPKPCVIHKKSRDGSKAVRAKYAAFIRYVKNIQKLMGGRIEIKEKPPRGYLRPGELLDLALSNEPEDHYAALAQLAWHNRWRSGNANVLAQFEGVLMRHHRDEMVETITLPRGVLEHDRFRSLFYGA